MSESSFNRRAALTLAVGAGATTILAADEVFANQPHMEKALGYLHHAKEELERAAHNKGGHRVDAIKSIDTAIRQVRRGIEAAKG